MIKKYAYNNNKGNVVLFDSIIENGEFASVADLRKEVDNINEDLNEKWGIDDSPLKFNDLLGIDLENDCFVLKEDIFYWNAEENDFMSIEDIQSFDEPSSWSNEEKVNFAEILLTWIATEDETYGLYKFIRDINENEEYAAMEKDKYSEKLERLIIKDIHSEKLASIFEEQYQMEKVEYKQYVENKDAEELVKANVSGGIQ